MNKNHFLASALCGGAFALAFFASCSNEKDLYDPEQAIKNKQAEYAKAFEAMFGKANANCDWGFGTTTSTRAAVTRGFDPQSNQWVKYVDIPAPLTNEQITIVTEWFETHQNPEGISVKWTDYFVQQVSSTEYGKHMDYLHADYSNLGEHINNFNNGDGGSKNVNYFGPGDTDNPNSSYDDKISFMTNSKTDFGYHDSNSTGKTEYDDYVIIPGDVISPKVAGMYFVGFDYQSHKDNGDTSTEVFLDGYYNDWIVKITPGMYKNAKRVFAEDMGTIGDFDFNDVVLDIALTDEEVTNYYPRESYYNTAVVTVRAAGGTLPLYIGSVDEEGKNEVHNLLGVAAGTMVNTEAGKHNEVAPAMIRVSGTFQNAGDVQILVNSTDAAYALNAPVGEAPQKICVPPTLDWCDERVNIKTVYPNFATYVSSGQPTNWWE